jgi:hypothetical protein
MNGQAARPLGSRPRGQIRACRDRASATTAERHDPDRHTGSCLIEVGPGGGRDPGAHVCGASFASGSDGGMPLRTNRPSIIMLSAQPPWRVPPASLRTGRGKPSRDSNRFGARSGSYRTRHPVGARESRRPAWCPGRGRMTSLPTAVTTPAISWPRTNREV